MYTYNFDSSKTDSTGRINIPWPFWPDYFWFFFSYFGLVSNWCNRLLLFNSVHVYCEGVCIIEMFAFMVMV